jgi:glycosidase
MRWDSGDSTLLDFYRRLIRVRRARPSARRGRRSLLIARDGVLAYETRRGEEKTVVVLNNSPELMTVEHDAIVGTDLLSHGALAGSVVLEPYTGTVIGTDG